VFQSSPLIAEGRNADTVITRVAIECFNPRPSSLRGATRVGRGGLRIRSRFNPRPSSLRGATPNRRRLEMARVSFNPRPSSLRGATRALPRNRLAT